MHIVLTTGLTRTTKLKISAFATAEEMRHAIRAAFPQVVGDFELLHCQPNRRLVPLPADVDCPSKLKTFVAMRRSALYIRPQSVAMIIMYITHHVNQYESSVFCTVPFPFHCLSLWHQLGFLLPQSVPRLAQRLDAMLNALCVQG